MRRRLSWPLFSALLLGVVSASGRAQSASQQRADSLLAARNWPAAGTAYSEVTTREPANGAAWSGFGESLLQQKRFDDSAAAFAKAESLRFRPFLSMVNQARAYAAKGDDNHALQLIQRVIDGGAGGAMRATILASTEFSRLTNDASWKRLLSLMKPCLATPYRQFDFWVGDWDVQDSHGTSVGHNLVTLEQEGCLLVEHWVSKPAGQTGTSFNYFDVRDKHWHQLYLDNTGNAGNFPELGGGFIDGKMVLLSADTNNVLTRWTWYVMEPGKVKQMAERSTDHGTTWTITWNSVYVKD